jgi:hypothetical protein
MLLMSTIQIPTETSVGPASAPGRSIQTRAISAQLNDRYLCCLAVQPDCSSKLRRQRQESHRSKQTQILSSWLDLSLNALSRLIGSEAGGVRRYRNRLHHELPDRNDRTQRKECVTQKERRRCFTAPRRRPSRRRPGRLRSWHRWRRAERKSKRARPVGPDARAGLRRRNVSIFPWSHHR